MPALLLVEDHAALGSSIASALERASNGRISITWTRAASAALKLLAEQRFDIALVDLSLPDAPGRDVIARCASLPAPVPAIAFTICDEESSVVSAVEAGAAGYVLKDEPIARVLEQIDECLRGGAPISSRAARHLFGARRVARESTGEHVALTPREHELLMALARGLTYEECAAVLGVKLGTVQTHVKALYRKLCVSTKAEAASWATRTGLAP